MFEAYKPKFYKKREKGEMIGTNDHPHLRAYHPARQLRLGSGKKIGRKRNRKDIEKRKDETYMQDLGEVSGRLENCACSYGTSSIRLT